MTHPATTAPGQPAAGRSSTAPPTSAAPAGFHHQAFLYAGLDDFLRGSLAFIHEGLARRERVMVAVGQNKIVALNRALGPAAAQVKFVDMVALGSNPARIIPAWADFVAGGQGCRGIGEPVWAERSPAALAECHRHEALLNLAFADSAAWHLLCPYDTAALDSAVIADATRTHPLLLQDSVEQGSPGYRGLALVEQHLSEPLPEPAGAVAEQRFGGGSLARLHQFVRSQAEAAGLGPARARELAGAVEELAGNSQRHGGGTGRLRLWSEGRELIWEVSDQGSFTQPLAGLQRPGAGLPGGGGLWKVNRVCDLVQIRTSPQGTLVRVHMSLPPSPASELEGLAQRAVIGLDRLGAAVRARLGRGSATVLAELSPSQVALLHATGAGPGARVETCPAGFAYVTELIRRGLATGNPSGSNQGSLALTPSGRRLTAALSRAWRQTAEEVAQRLTADQRATVLALATAWAQAEG